MPLYIHETAEVSDLATIGKNTKIWNNAQVREHAVIGENCILSKDVYIDTGVNIGNSCKIQNSVSVYSGVTLENNVFIGPNACFTNDLTPRAFNNDWHTVKTQICEGASIGANATIICGNKIGKFAMIGAGTVVTKDIPEYALAVGNPARVVGYVDKNGNQVSSEKIDQ